MCLAVVCSQSLEIGCAACWYLSINEWQLSVVCVARFASDLGAHGCSQRWSATPQTTEQRSSMAIAKPLSGRQSREVAMWLSREACRTPPCVTLWKDEAGEVQEEVLSISVAVVGTHAQL